MEEDAFQLKPLQPWSNSVTWIIWIICCWIHSIIYFSAETTSAKWTAAIFNQVNYSLTELFVAEFHIISRHQIFFRLLYPDEVSAKCCSVKLSALFFAFFLRLFPPFGGQQVISALVRILGAERASIKKKIFCSKTKEDTSIFVQLNLISLFAQ